MGAHQLFVPALTSTLSVPSTPAPKALVADRACNFITGVPFHWRPFGQYTHSVRTPVRSHLNRSCRSPDCERDFSSGVLFATQFWWM